MFINFFNMDIMGYRIWDILGLIVMYTTFREKKTSFDWLKLTLNLGSSNFCFFGGSLCCKNLYSRDIPKIGSTTNQLFSWKPKGKLPPATCPGKKVYIPPKFNSLPGCPCKNDGWKMSLLLGWLIFRGHVKVPGSIRPY